MSPKIGETKQPCQGLLKNRRIQKRFSESKEREGRRDKGGEGEGEREGLALRLDRAVRFVRNLRSVEVPRGRTRSGAKG